MDRRRQRALKLRQQFLDAVGDFDDIGARLTLDVDDHGRGVIHPSRLFHVLGIIDHIGDIGQHDGCPIAIGDNEGPVLLTREDLIVGPNDGGLPRAIERALGLIHVGGRNNRPQIFKRQSIRRQRRWIGLNPHGRPLPATYADESHSRELGNFLRKPGIGKILNLGHRQGIRRQCQRQDGSIGRVDLAVDRRVRQILRQEGRRRVDRRLHLLLGDI